MFPKSVTDGGSHWTLIESHQSNTSTIGNIISDNEVEIKDKFVIDHSNDHYKIVKRTKITPTKSPRLNQRWGHSQSIFNLKCTCNQASFIVRRKSGTIAVYQKGNHCHQYGLKADNICEVGLPSNLKAFLRPFVGLPNAMKHAIIRLTLLEPDKQTDVLLPYKLEDLEDTSSLKEKIKGYLKREKKKMTSTHVSKTDLIIGPSQKDLLVYLRKHMVTIETLAQYCRNGNAPKNKLWIVYEDVSTNGNGRFTHITFLHSDAIALIRSAVSATASRSSFAFQSEVDYTHLDSDHGLVLGVVGTSDAQRHFHPIIYDLNVTENAVGSTRMLKLVDMLTLCISQKHITVLKDASLALEKATNSNLNLEARDCLTHKVRSKTWTNKKGVSGTRGSLETYMMSKSCKQVEISQLLSVMLALDTLPTIEKYQAAVILLYKDFDMPNRWSFSATATVKDHIKSNYFPLQPRIGPIHMPGEVHSSNGLERKWYPTKQGIDIYRQQQNLGLVEATLRTIENRSIIQWTSVTYQSKPKSTKEQWDVVRNCAVYLPASLRHMLVYSNHQKLLFTEVFEPISLKNLFEREMFQSLRIYIPSWDFLEKAYAEAANIDLQGLDENGRKWLRNAQNGKELTEAILSSVAANVGRNLYKMNCAPLDKDDTYTYLKRHGQRGISLFNYKNLPTSPRGSVRDIHKKIKREHEQKQEYDKWIEHEQIVSEDGTSESKATSPKSKGSERKVNLKEKELGSFLCLSILRGRSDAILDAVDDGYEVKCTCEAFRVDGTCFESKLFGWILLDRKPEKEFLPHITDGIKEEREAILKVIQSSCCRTSQTPLDAEAPLIDPVHSK